MSHTCNTFNLDSLPKITSHACRSPSWINFDFSADSRDSRKKAFASVSAHSSLHTMELKHRELAREENLAYFFPPLISVLSVFMDEGSLLFRDALKLDFHNNGLCLPSMADQWSSFKPENGECEAECLLSCWPPVFTLWHLLIIPVASHSLPQRKRRAEEAAIPVENHYCSVGALLNPLSSRGLKRAPSYYYSSGHNLRCFCELCSPRLRDHRLISALWKQSQLTGLPCFCRHSGMLAIIKAI